MKLPPSEHRERDGARRYRPPGPTGYAGHLGLHLAETRILEAVFHHRRDGDAGRDGIAADTLRPVLGGDVGGQCRQAALAAEYAPPRRPPTTAKVDVTLMIAEPDACADHVPGEPERARSIKPRK